MSTGMFGGVHLLALGVSVAYIIIALLVFSKKKVSLNFINKYLLIIGIISESIKVVTYIIKNESTMHGYLPKTDLPLHLCSIQILFAVILCLSKYKNVKKILYSFMLPTCLVGGFFALLLATESSRSIPIITVQYFLFHSTIIIFAIYLYITKEIKLEFKDYLTSLICLFATFFVAIYLNSIINDGVSNINFMYVVKPPQESLPYLTIKYGWGVYIAHYALLSIFSVSLCYVKPIITKLKSVFNK